LTKKGAVVLQGESSPLPSATGGRVPDPAISIQGVSKRFGEHVVLEDITFDVPRGETSAILGPSGTGKSVLLKVIIGLLRPEAGQVYIDGEPMVGVREKEVLRIRRKIGVLFQDGALFGSMNLFDNIAFPLIEHTNKTDKEVREIVLEKSELVGLVNHLHKLPGEVSGGMRKRAGLARALVLEPKILFFDEPDSGLDPVRVAYLDVGEENGPLPGVALQVQAGGFRLQGGDDHLEGPGGRAVPGRTTGGADRHGRDGRRRGG
jgi:ABC-type transporter Mla maintaining outer membrane lipid asymmetry ATPase subunit MlaF